MVDKALSTWTQIANQIPDPVLRQQALSSLRHKKFHAQGGNVYALYPKAHIINTVNFITALQTISDYLDNLCDRAGVKDEASFRQLHLAMSDALDIKKGQHDYYSLYPYQNDNGYLLKLVQTCQTQLSELPSYHLVEATIGKYIRYYTDLQSYKHLQIPIRENLLLLWAFKGLTEYPEIEWQEFAAATGSTLGIFLFIAAASDPELTPGEVDTIDQAYFPWINGLHILLDYYIDSQEDLQMGDLNFTHYYKNSSYCRERLAFFISQSLKYGSHIRFPKFHRTIIKGLLAMYLSDPKALTIQNKPITKKLIHYGGLQTAFFYRSCRLLRFMKKL